MNDGEKLALALNIDKRNKTTIAKKLKISRVSLNQWTKREYLSPKVINKLKEVGIDINQHAVFNSQEKSQDIRLTNGRFTKVIFPVDITNADIDRIISVIRLWKVGK